MSENKIQDINNHLDRLTKGINKLNDLPLEYPELKEYMQKLVKK